MMNGILMPKMAILLFSKFLLVQHEKDILLSGRIHWIPEYFETNNTAKQFIWLKLRIYNMTDNIALIDQE